MRRKLPWLYLIIYGYTHGTRLQSPRALAARLITEQFVVLYVVYVVVFGATADWYGAGAILIQGILGYIVLNSLYEGGYFVNDAVSTKFESEPTLRAVEAHDLLGEFLLSRAIWWGVGLFFLIELGIPISRLLLASATLVLIFALHNSLPSGSAAKLLSFAGLRVLRYGFVPFLLAPASVLPVLLVMLPVLVLGLARYSLNKFSWYRKSLARPFAAGVMPYSLALMTFLPLQAALLWPTGTLLLLPNALIAVAGMLGLWWKGWRGTPAPTVRNGLTTRW